MNPSISAYNLRLVRRPSRCLTGPTIPPGLVGFCHETPLSLPVLDEQHPRLAVLPAFLDGVHRASPSPDLVLALCAGFVAQRIERGDEIPVTPPQRPTAWPAQALWPW